MTKAKKMTFGELRDALATMTPEQLAAPVRWWGEERGGVINGLRILDEPYYHTDEGMVPDSGMGPLGADEARDEYGPPLPTGTPVLETDL